MQTLGFIVVSVSSALGALVKLVPLIFVLTDAAKGSAGTARGSRWGQPRALWGRPVWG